MSPTYSLQGVNAHLIAKNITKITKATIQNAQSILLPVMTFPGSLKTIDRKGLEKLLTNAYGRLKRVSTILNHGRPPQQHISNPDIWCVIASESSVYAAVNAVGTTMIVPPNHIEDWPFKEFVQRHS